MNKIKYFQRGGKNLPTAPDAKEAYKGGTYTDGVNKDVITGPPIVDSFPRTITQKINSNDTTYIETPPYDPIARIIVPRGRKASSSDKDRDEYNILKRRFEQAAQVVNDTVPTNFKKFMSWGKSYFQQGGTMNQQQDIQQQIMKLVQAAIQGNQEAIDKINQIEQAAQQGDPQAAQLKQMIQQVVEQMKGQATSAKWGSKLQYIKSLKYAKGGKTCPSCQNGGIPNNTKNNPDKLKNKIEEKACGGKTKKKYFGGWI